MKRITFLLAVIASTNVMANGFTMQCGNFTMQATLGEMSKINGERVTSQKITELGKDGLKVDMTLDSVRDGNFYGFEYVHPDGSNKRWLNVELIRTSMRQPRIIGTFMCQRVAG
nr:MAG TPA: hypothetical protein [Caudoviricetes sp.]